jgi:hypothetical protein
MLLHTAIVLMMLLLMMLLLVVLLLLLLLRVIDAPVAIFVKLLRRLLILL